ncbi:uncharacterized protein METZ01_LOCUS424638, partial [marine metagenome]
VCEPFYAQGKGRPGIPPGTTHRRNRNAKDVPHFLRSDKPLQVNVLV